MSCSHHTSHTHTSHAHAHTSHILTWAPEWPWRKVCAPWSVCEPWAPSYCDLHSRVAWQRAMRGVVAWDPWAPPIAFLRSRVAGRKVCAPVVAFCDLHLGRGARARWRWHCHCDLRSSEVLVRARDAAAIGVHRPRVDCARVGDLVPVRDGAAIVVRRQRVDCAHVGDGAAVVTCRQDVVPCRGGRGVSCCVVSCRVMSRRGMSRRGMSRRVVSRVMSSQVMSCCDVLPCHAGSCRITSSLTCHVTSRHVTSCHVTSCHVMSYRVMSCHVASCPVAMRGFASPRAKGGHNTWTQLPRSHTTHTHAAQAHTAQAHTTHVHTSRVRGRWHSHSSVYQPHSFTDVVWPTHLFDVSGRCGVIRSNHLNLAGGLSLILRELWTHQQHKPPQPHDPRPFGGSSGKQRTSTDTNGQKTRGNKKYTTGKPST